MNTRHYQSPSCEVILVETMEILCASTQGSYGASFTDFENLGTLDLN